MSSESWTVDQSNGELLIMTGVEGRAAKMGHRLTIAVNRWQSSIEWVDGEPRGAELTADVDSLEVRSGAGGLTPLTGPERSLARSNALNVLHATKFPQIRVHTTDIEKGDDGYRLSGTVELHGKTRHHTVDLHVDESSDGWRMSWRTELRQSDFGIKPYSMFLGSMKVADVVAISFAVVRAKNQA